MAPSRPSSLPLPLRALVAALGALAYAHAAQAASFDKCAESIVVESKGGGANFKKNTTEFKDVVISACDMRIEAKRARSTALNFENSTWTFDGDVRIRTEERGSLRSDLAVVDFRNNRIDRVTITGSPAEFEQKRTDSDTTARGRARQIVYELSAGTISLTDDAWVSDGGSTEVKGSQLVYDIRQQVVLATSGAGKGDRVRMTITPKSSPKPPKSGGKQATPAPAAGPTTPPPASGSPANPDKSLAPMIQAP